MDKKDRGFSTPFETLTVKIIGPCNLESLYYDDSIVTVLRREHTDDAQVIVDPKFRPSNFPDCDLSTVKV